jgi:hypothetical protein
MPSGCLAFGIPCKVIKKDAYPVERDWKLVIMNFLRFYDYSNVEIVEDGLMYRGAFFDLVNRRIEGKSSIATFELKNRLRRWGIRFKSEVMNGQYQDWDENGD